jgi:hypothetical protein
MGVGLAVGKVQHTIQGQGRISTFLVPPVPGSADSVSLPCSARHLERDRLTVRNDTATEAVGEETSQASRFAAQWESLEAGWAVQDLQYITDQAGWVTPSRTLLHAHFSER